MLFWLATALAGPPAWDALADASRWKEVATRKSDVGLVRVRHQRVEGVDCLEGITTTAVPPDVLLDVAADVPSATAWSSAGLRTSEVLARDGDVQQYWQHLDVPNWTLVADRYWVLEGRSFREGADRRFRWQRIDAAVTWPETVERAQAAERGAIEVPANWGEWFFEAVSEGTRVHYRACADIGGRIPESIQRWVATRTLPDTVADLVREAGRRAGAR